MADLQDQVFSDHQPVTRITRCLHFDEAFTVMEARKFEPQDVHPWPHSDSPQVIWFSPWRSPRKHNIFGNVGFVVKTADFLETPKKAGVGSFYFYYIDTREQLNRTITRILVSSRMHYELKRFDLTSYRNSPIQISSNETFKVARKISQNGSVKKNHSVYFAVEDHSDIGRYLYAVATKEAVEHSHANKYSDGKMETKQCFRYNNRWKKCEYPLLQHKAKDELDAYMSKGLRNEPECYHLPHAQSSSGSARYDHAHDMSAGLQSLCLSDNRQSSRAVRNNAESHDVVEKEEEGMSGLQVAGLVAGGLFCVAALLGASVAESNKKQKKKPWWEL